MDKLFDEVHEYSATDHRRTIWYGYSEGGLDDEFVSSIKDLIKNDLATKQCATISETHWIIYGVALNEDALGEKVRPSLMIRERDGKFAANCNISDLSFAMYFDMVNEFKCKLEESLNSENSSQISIREILQFELPILEDMLYEAIFQKEGAELVPRSVIKQPEINIYIDSFGKPHDYCLVADCDGKIIGAVWVRILAGERKGYGNIDDKTPEFAISLYKEYRNQGIGTALMKAMIEYLKEKGYEQTSLSVAKDNYAVRMYKALGFKVIREKHDDYLMVLKLRNL